MKLSASMPHTSGSGQVRKYAIGILLYCDKLIFT